MITDKEYKEKEVEEVRLEVGSEPCKPTTSACARPAHFVCGKKQKKISRTEVVPIRFTKDEHTQLLEKASACHLSLSEFIRRIAFKRKIEVSVIPELNRQIYLALGAIGNNLNQLTKSVHLGQVTIIGLAQFDALMTLLKEIRSQLCGPLESR